MKPKQTNQQDMAFYEKVVERNLDSMLGREDVVSFGVGYKVKDDKRTDAVSLVVEVVEKKTNVPKSKQIPATIDGVPTDVVQRIEKPETPKAAPSQRASGRASASTSTWKPEPPPRIPNTDFNPLVGGIPIRNPKIGKANAGVLGAIVFDAKSGQPMGLSVQHAIGRQKKGDWAKIKDPIHQPMKQESKYKIGTLYKIDKEYDAALFKLNSKREYSHKVKGKDEDYELGEPIRPYLGMKVECLGRHRYATGEVDHIYWQRRSDSTYMCLIKIMFDKGCKTRGGDSGSLWVDIATKRPVGLHRRYYRYYFSTRKRRLGTAAKASCIYQLATDWHKFRFSQPLSQKLEGELEKYETEFAQKGNSLISFCYQPGTAEKLLIKKFNQKLEKTSELANDIYPMSGIAVATLEGSTKSKRSTLAFWRSANDNKIQFGKLSANGTKLTNLSSFDFRTLHKPAVISFKKRLIMAFVDAATSKITIVSTSDGKNWRFSVSTMKSGSAPSMTVFKNTALICWAAQGSRQLRIGELTASGRSYSLSSYSSLSGEYSFLDPAICADDDKLYLAYTTYSDELKVKESPDRWNWSVKSLIEKQSKASPSLFCFNNELIWARRQT